MRFTILSFIEFCMLKGTLPYLNLLSLSCTNNQVEEAVHRKVFSLLSCGI